MNVFGVIDMCVGLVSSVQIFGDWFFFYCVLLE